MRDLPTDTKRGLAIGLLGNRGISEIVYLPRYRVRIPGLKPNTLRPMPKQLFGLPRKIGMKGPNSGAHPRVWTKEIPRLTGQSFLIFRV